MNKTFNIIKFYYFLTPVFFILDSVWEQTFRVAGLENQTYRYTYYGLCLICALICALNQYLSVIVSLLESGINMLILIMSVMLPVFTAGQNVERDIISIGLNGQKLINFILIGSLICYSFYAAQSAMKTGGQSNN